MAFDRELSIVGAPAASTAPSPCYPLVENHHADGILRTHVAPAPGTHAGAAGRGEPIAAACSTRSATSASLAVELFEVGGGLVANEMAPRVHNSGHWTIEGADTSQFEQHLRAVLRLAAGRSPRPRGGRDGEPDRRRARRRRRAGRAGRAPPPLRQGAPAGPQARSRHRRGDDPGERTQRLLQLDHALDPDQQIGTIGVQPP